MPFLVFSIFWSEIQCDFSCFQYFEVKFRAISRVFNNFEWNSMLFLVLLIFRVKSHAVSHIFNILEWNLRWFLVYSIFWSEIQDGFLYFHLPSASYFSVSFFQKIVRKVPVCLQSAYLLILSKRSFHIVSLYLHSASLLVHCFLFRFMYVFLCYCSSHPKSE